VAANAEGTANPMQASAERRKRFCDWSFMNLGKFRVQWCLLKMEANEGLGQRLEHSTCLQLIAGLCIRV
jgi:hypothetical protein